MKKLITLCLVIVLVLSLSACSGGLTLDKNQSMIEINKKDVVFTIVFNENEFAADFKIDTTQRASKIENDFKDFLEKDESGNYMKLESIKVKKNLVTVVIQVDDIYEMDIEMGDFNDLINDYGYKDVKEFAETFPFVLYRNEKEIDSSKMTKYESYKYIELGPLTQQGTYFKIPGKIAAVARDLAFEYEGNDTILVTGNSSYGWILYK